MNITRKIVNFAHLDENTYVLEIGPGPGGLTLAILEKQPRRLVTIEKDERCLPGLEELILTGSDSPRTTVEIVHDDALRILPQLLADASQPLIVIANLPYNIASPLLLEFIHHQKNIKEMVLMFQKEVAQRIVASPGTKHYGRLSIVTQAVFDVSVVYNLPPSVFTPPPKVHSAVVHFIPHSRYQNISIAQLESITHIFFSNRRKTIGHIVKAHFANNAAIQAILAPYAHLRPENLMVDLYVQVASTIKN